MFELKICGLSEALELSRQWATHTISLLNPEFEDNDEYTFLLPIAGKDSLLQRYYFSDDSFKAATAEKIQEILKFTAPLQATDKLLVHCIGGISQSTAVACGVLCQHGFTPREAVKYVLSIRSIAYPNPHILALFDEILGLDGKLMAIVTESQLD